MITAINIIIPAAGAGSRFALAGFTRSKPLIDVKGKPMLTHVIENIDMSSFCKTRFYVLCRPDLFEHMPFELLEMQNVAWITVPRLTGGAAMTVLKAREFVDSDDPLIVINSDQYVDYDKEAFYKSFTENDGSVMTFTDDNPRWSYAKSDDDGFVAEIAEKRVISHSPTVGCYATRRGSDFIGAIDEMIASGDMTNGESYVAPSINYLINRNLKIKAFPVNHMWSTGTPELLKENYYFIGH